MTVKERLHHLVDELPESEAPTAARILEALRVAADPVRSALERAPLDDEPLTEEETATLAEMENGGEERVYSHQEIKREFGLA